jgi:hypothetical protein
MNNHVSWRIRNISSCFRRSTSAFSLKDILWSITLEIRDPSRSLVHDVGCQTPRGVGLLVRENKPGSLRDLGESRLPVFPSLSNIRLIQHVPRPGGLCPQTCRRDSKESPSTGSMAPWRCGSECKKCCFGRLSTVEFGTGASRGCAGYSLEGWLIVVSVMSQGGPITRYAELVRSGRLREDSHQKGAS